MTPETLARIRAELWSRVYAGVLSHRSGYPSVCIEAADKAVDEFDKRFKAAKVTATGQPNHFHLQPNHEVESVGEIVKVTRR